MGELSPWHWLVVILIAALLFGAKRLPDAARSLGRSARILRAELRADEGPAPAAADVPASAPPAPAHVAPPSPTAAAPAPPDTADVPAPSAAAQTGSTDRSG